MQELICYRLSRLPDFQTARYRTLFGDDVRSRVMEAQRSFLMLLHSLGSEGELGISLRYLFDPGGPAGAGLSVYLLVRNGLPVEDRKVRDVIENSPLDAFYPFVKSGRRGVFEPLAEKDIPTHALDPSEFTVAVETVKEEARFDSILVNYDGPMEQSLLQSPFHKVPYHVIYPFEPVADNDMTFLDRQFQSFGRRMMVEVTLAPTAVTPAEAEAMTKILGALEEVTSAGSFSINTSVSQSGNLPKDLLAEMVQERIRETQETAFTERFFSFALRTYGDDRTYTLALADMLALAGSSCGRYRKSCFERGEGGFAAVAGASASVKPDSGLLWREYWDRVPESYQTFLAMKRMPRLAHVDELAPFFRVMVPGTEPLQTIALENELAFALDEETPTVHIGHDFFKPSRQIHVELGQLRKHMFIAGVPGSGKTMAVFNLLFQLHCEGVPFLVIEPAKTEYRLLKRLAEMDEESTAKTLVDDATWQAGRSLGEELRIYSVGNDLVSPFRFNPFEFPRGIGLFEHISNLEACFRGALPISTGPLPALINEATEEIYRDLGWRGDDVADGSKPFPTMQNLYDKISRIFETKDYSADVKGDLKTAIEVRIGTLLRRNMGRIFNTRVSAPDVETMMNTPVVIELDYLNEEQANLMTMFILSRVREHVRATRTSKSALCHVIVIEEAHNIVGRTEGPGGEDQANPKAEATKYVSRFLAEVRALGEGLVIADQLPSAVAPEVVKNTNIKLVHRLVAGDDREDIGMTMLLDPTQMEDLARLNPGEAYLFQEGMYRPTRVDEIYIVDTFPTLAQPPPDHEELIEMLQRDSWWTRGVFHEALAIGRGLEDLAADMEGNYAALLREINTVAERFGDDLARYRALGARLNGQLALWDARHAEVRERQVSFFRLMSRRSALCREIAERECRPVLLAAEKALLRLWGQIDRLAEDLDQLAGALNESEVSDE